MGQVVYQFSGSTLKFLQSAFPQVLGEEMYAGEIGVRNGQGGDVTLEKGTTLPVPILALRSRITTTMRRTHRHVREAGKQFYVVWLIEKGQLSISCSNGVKTLAANTIMITDSNNPFYIEALTGEAGEHCNKLALVPSHLLHSHFPKHGQLNTMSFAARSGDGKVVAGLINLLFETGEVMDHDDASTMLGLLLRALGRLVGTEAAGSFEHRSMHEVRLAQVQSYIDLHLANHRLALADVAGMCGISTRYLSQVMQKAGTSFATALRERRLAEARNWLSAADKRGYTIGEIAKIVGYGSGAQFSRSFQARFACRPRDFRKQTSGDRAPADGGEPGASRLS